MEIHQQTNNDHSNGFYAYRWLNNGVDCAQNFYYLHSVDGRIKRVYTVYNIASDDRKKKKKKPKHLFPLYS